MSERSTTLFSHVVHVYWSFYKYSLLLIPQPFFALLAFSQTPFGRLFIINLFNPLFFYNHLIRVLPFVLKPFSVFGGVSTHIWTVTYRSHLPLVFLNASFSLFGPPFSFSHPPAVLLLFFISNITFFFLSLSGWVPSVVEESCSLKDKWKED